MNTLSKSDRLARADWRERRESASHYLPFSPADAIFRSRYRSAVRRSDRRATYRVKCCIYRARMFQQAPGWLQQGSGRTWGMRTRDTRSSCARRSPGNLYQADPNQFLRLRSRSGASSTACVLYSEPILKLLWTWACLKGPGSRASPLSRPCFQNSCWNSLTCVPSCLKLPL